MRKMLLLIVCAMIMAPHPSRAQQLIERYQAYLSEQDHFSSNGQRLTSAAAIIRQDRANFHRFGIRDREDEDDSFFGDMENRAALERLLERGRAAPGVISQIVDGTPLVRVEVWRGPVGPYVAVTILQNNAGTPSQQSPTGSNESGDEKHVDENVRSSTDCNESYQAKQYEIAERCWRTKAEAGDLNSQFDLAKFYYQSSTPDKKQAAAWFTTAAERGHVGAQSFIALMYLNGWGVPKSPDAAIMWFEKAAKSGDLSSAQNLAVQFKNGDLLPRDLNLATQWCQYYVDRLRPEDVPLELKAGCKKWTGGQ
jgi:hypothetical protein